MKNILLLIIIITGLTACSKVAPAGSITVTGKGPDTVTITDNGTTYTCIGNPIAQNDNVYCRLFASASTTYIQLATSNSDACPISMTASALQLFFVYPNTDTSLYENTSGQLNGSENIFTELFNGGESYNVDTVLMDINTVSGSTITGTYELWLHNAAGNKIVTGTIRCHSATISN